MRKVVGSNPDDDLYRIVSFTFAIDLEGDCYETVKPGLLETTSKCERQEVV